MLESAGYEVETAVDGEEGLRKAFAQNYRVISGDRRSQKIDIDYRHAVSALKERQLL